VGRKERQRVGVEPHRDGPTVPHDVFDPLPLAVAAVRNQMIVRGNGKLRQRISRSQPLGRCQRKGIAGKLGEAKAIMDPPQTARLPRLFDRRAIHQPEGSVLVVLRPHHPLLLQQRETESPQPFLRLPQPFQQGNIRDSRQPRQVRPHGGLP
jgi:hypothetical protein